MKRTLSVCLCLLLCLAILSGCGDVEESSSAVESARESHGENSSAVESLPQESSEESKSQNTENTPPVEEEEGSLTDLLAGITAQEPEETVTALDYSPMLVDLALRLAQTTQAQDKESNLLVSPLSVFCAMAMVSNGAVDTEVVADFWGGNGVQSINSFMHEYLASLKNTEKSKLHLANAVWFTEDASFTVNRDFLQTMADYYKASAFQAPFDEQTCKDINNWVERNTDGMIKDLLNEIPEDAVMYLVNALAFEAEWFSPYAEGSVREGVFHGANGSDRTVQMMHGVNVYLEDDYATGFRKSYRGNYSFVAMLPKEGMNVEDYLASLTGENLYELLNAPSGGEAITAMPEFETEFKTDLRSVLLSMGYPLNGCFDGVGTSTKGPVTTSRILHKTYITVGPLGTKAGAATLIEMPTGSAENPVYAGTVVLDRPFVYMIVDNEYNIPLFIGTVQNVG